MLKRFGKSFMTRYFNSYWMPILILLLLSSLNVSILNKTIGSNEYMVLQEYFQYFVQLFAFGILFAGLWNIYKRRWGKGIFNISLFSLPALFLYGLLQASHDDFADNLMIPTDIEVNEPLERSRNNVVDHNDTFQKEMILALQQTNSHNSDVNLTIPNLINLYKANSKTLLHYLAMSPEWRVYQKNNNIFATKRWMISDQWHTTLNGYYTSTDLCMGIVNCIKKPYFEHRLTLGFAGKPWVTHGHGSTSMNFGSVKELDLQIHTRRFSIFNKERKKFEQKEESVFKSLLIAKADKLSLEIFEKSNAMERRLTNKSIKLLDDQLKPLLTDHTIEKMKKLIPSNGIKVAKPSFSLIHTHSPGIYNARIWVNPGEPGMIYLKAFEVTQNTPLSISRLKNSSNEWVGYSDNLSETFLSHTQITIYEGSWGKPYAARFEVWFQPDDGKSERKLLEKVYKIEGWSR